MKSRLSSLNWNRSLMARLAGYYMLLSLLTVTAVGFAVYFQAARSLQVAVFDHLRSVAVLKDASLNRWVDEQRRNLAFIAWLPEVQEQAGRLVNLPASDPDYQQAHAVLDSYLAYVVSSVSDTEEIFFLNLDGLILLSTNPARENLQRASAPYFKNGLTATIVQPFYTDPENGRPMITVATPIFDTNKRRIGVLAAHLNLARIDRIILERSGLGQSGETYLVNPARRFVSSPRFTGETNASSAASEGIDAALSGQSGQGMYANYLGVPVIGVYEWLDEQQVALVAEMSQQEALAPARRLAWNTVAVGLVSALLLGIMVYLLARQIAKPILAISAAAHQVTEGDLDAAAPVLTKDEVGDLAISFNLMVAQLRLLYAGLEKKVNERTADLVHSNQRLQIEIGERRRAEEALRAQNEYLAILHETSLGIISRLDLKDLLEVLVTRACQMVLTSSGFIDLVDPEHDEIECRVGVGVFAETIGLRLKAGQGLSGQVWQNRQTMLIENYAAWPGRARNQQFDPLRAAVGLPLSSQGQVIGVLGLARQDQDPDRLFTPEEVALLGRFAQLASIALDNALLYTHAEQARMEAESANRAKSAFLANMSHELRTPLNAIMGFTRIVLRKSSDQLPPRQIENLDKVLMSAEHLLGLINTILDIAKIEAGRMDVQVGLFNPASLVELCIMTTQPLVKPGVALVAQVDEGLPLINSDQEKVKQILINLLSNAAKFTYQGRITLHSRAHSDGVLFDVIDTGIGIPAEAQERIFEEFQQADSSTTRQYGGTGLGLSISRRLAVLLAGRLTVISQEGQGSTFTLQIPKNYFPPHTHQKPV